jgi:hypothetical protein
VTGFSEPCYSLKTISGMSLHFPAGHHSESEARIAAWVRRLTISFCLIAIVLGAAEAWTSRFAMNTDGVQYLDNATAYSNGDLHGALNSQWSPMYPWLIGAMFAAVRPGPYWEFPLVHLLNFLIYLLTLAGFLFFLSSVPALIPANRHTPAIRLSLVLISGSAFLYCSLDFTSLAYVTPDLLVNLFAYLAAGVLLRIAAGATSASQYVALGLILGLGYLAKTPLLLIGLLCLAIAAALVLKQRPAHLARLGLTAATFAAIAVPYIWTLSNAKGRFTAGDSGRLNVIWMVNRVPYYNWQGGPSGNGKPIHPTRQLSTNPAVFEFATPIGGTYPPWYDPTYWSEGATVAIRAADFAHALLRQVQFYGYLVHHRQLPLVFGLATLCLLASNKRCTLTAITRFWPILLLGAMPFAMYALVHAEGRYLGPFFVLLWTGLAAGILTGLDDNLDPRVLLAIVMVAATLMLLEAVTSTSLAVSTQKHYLVAQGIERLGLKRGDPVAMVTGDLDYFWARLAGAHITMEVDFGSPACPDCGQHAAEWDKAKPILAANGVVMVVSPCIPGVVDQPGWQQLGATGAYAYRLR